MKVQFLKGRGGGETPTSPGKGVLKGQEVIGTQRIFITLLCVHTLQESNQASYLKVLLQVKVCSGTNVGWRQG